MIDQIVKWIEDYAKKANREALVVGVSGGIDSAVIAKLCERTSLRLICVSMAFGEKESTERARELVAGMDCDFVVVDIQPILYGYGIDFEHNIKLRIGNLCARIRTNILYDIACEHNGLVVGTCNLDELNTGYFTKGGDGLSDIEPLGRIHKSGVYAMAPELGVPTSTINTAPTAELWEGQTDEGELGLTYDEIEEIIKGHGSLVIGPDKMARYTQLHTSTEHKRRLPPVFEPSTDIPTTDAQE